MRNRFLVVLAVSGLVAPTPAAIAAQDSSTGGAAAPTREKTSSSNNKKKVKLPRILKKIAECESGGDPHAVSPSGKYRGKYQFSRSTWRSMGGHGDPAKASEYEQDKRALKLYHEQGTAPWPYCGKWAREHS